MKALFSRFNRNSARDREIASLPGLPQWPPPPKGQKDSASLGPPSPKTAKPLPDLNLRPLPPIALEDPAPSPTKPEKPAPPPPAQNGAPANGGDVQKKVAFLSPPPSASALNGPGGSDWTAAAGSASETQARRKPGPLDTPPLKQSKGAHHAQGESRGSTSSAGPATSKVSLATSARGHPASLRPATSSPIHSTRTFHNEAASLRSGSPYSQTSSRTAILMTQSWSEGAEGDLVSNIGQRERTRQEVLWEIVASEERYVQELVKLKEIFIEPLLHPYSAASPTLGPSPDPDDFYRREATPVESVEHLPIASRFLSSRAASGASAEPPSTPPHHPLRTETPVIPPADGESLDTEEDEAVEAARARSMEAAKHNHPRSPYGTAARQATQGRKKLTVPFPSAARSHHSLPPPPRNNAALAASTASLGRQTLNQRLMSDPQRQAATGSPASRVLRKLQKKSASQAIDTNGSIAPHLLPEDLRRCLEVLESGIIPGHHILSEGLRKRYDEQYPLVRSLADVFVANSHILHEYATYVLHLERALEQVDDALSNASVMKRPKKQDAADWAKFCKFLQSLEDEAAARSETGMAISLSKPFQRLLKYPLLFQNLLFHTDPSTFEYESTLLMVSEVETIVRSIEDEKIQKEERDRTRDVFARIEGLEKVKMLALPKPSRLLVEEKPLLPDTIQENPSASNKSSPPPALRPGVKPKTSFKRLSDVLSGSGGSSGIGGKKDLWLVAFNDVILRCQRTGTTCLPIASATSSTSSRTNSMPELQAKAKYSSNGRRASQGKPRNLYKFIKIETWDIGEVAKPREGIIHMEEITRTRALSNAASSPPDGLPVPTEEDEDEGAESDESDRKSKMSFSYWGADRVTLTTPRPKVPARTGRGASTATTGVGRRAQIPSSYTRESSANAKFGTRLVSSPDSAASGSTGRPASRRQQATGTTSASSRRTPAPSSDDGDERTTMRSTRTPINRPAWNGSTRITTTPTQPTTTSSPAKRARTPSTSGAQPPRLVSKASSAASEDSGIGLYRQLVAQDPTLKGT